MKYYSQYGQDKFINEILLKYQVLGVFVDVGAYDGIIGSNTYFFEKNMGWDGICIEPNPEIYKKLTENRKCQCINGCALDKNGQVDFRMISGYSEMLSGIIHEFDNKHIDRINSENCEYRDIKVDCYDLNELLINNDVTNITYMSIDTEGSEYSIIKNLNLNKIKIKVFSVENNYNSNEVEIYLKSFNYTKIARIEIDDIYVKHF